MDNLALYLIAGAVILFVLGQSIFFLVKAWKHGKELGIDKSKLKNAVTSSALFTIPSALSVLATVIALAPALGLVIPWVRLSVLGNITYETVAATEAINAFGITTGISEAITDPEAFAGVACGNNSSGDFIKFLLLTQFLFIYFSWRLITTL